jgi:hypothetical protein
MQAFAQSAFICVHPRLIFSVPLETRMPDNIAMGTRAFSKNWLGLGSV